MGGGRGGVDKEGSALQVDRGGRQTNREAHLDPVLWERALQVVQGEKGVVEVQGVEGARHPGGNRRVNTVTPIFMAPSHLT